MKRGVYHGHHYSYRHSGCNTGAVLDEAHVGDIRGALGTISADDFAPRVGLSAKLKTLLAIVCPG